MAWGLPVSGVRGPRGVLQFSCRNHLVFEVTPKFHKLIQIPQPFGPKKTRFKNCIFFPWNYNLQVIHTNIVLYEMHTAEQLLIICFTPLVVGNMLNEEP